MNYPIELDRAAIERVLPHRGEILCVQRIVVRAHDRYIGQALWRHDLPILQGHFPGRPLVPGVLLVEATAQVAGAGMLVGDAYGSSMGDGYIGVLAGIRKCSFKAPVRADEQVAIDVQARRMSNEAAIVSAQLHAGTVEVATVEILVVNTPRSTFEARLRQMGEAAR